ncbi:MAG: hypothetical protein EXQ94_00505 [Alphaproteobacteria bacterium]|nr:hypothetical protein [Alphaproteobacteria bacterium]
MFAGEDQSDTLKIGVVLFAGTVNIGTGMASDVKDNPGAPNRFAGTTWRGCVEARPHPYDIEDSYVANTSPGGQWRAYSWHAHVIQNNWPAITATRGPNKQCHVESVLPLSDQKSSVDGIIDALTTDGQTNIAAGAYWGWAVLSPQEPFTDGSEYGDDETDKIMIIMTDGENFVSTATGSYSAFGTIAEANAALGCPTNLSACKLAELNQRTAEVCEAIKDEEITVYTIGFDIDDASPVLDLLEDCATDQNKFFVSPTNADLEATFATIGNELMNLRIGH